MRKLLIASLVLSMMLAAAPAFATVGQWWSGPINTILTITTPTPEKSGNTLLVSTYERYKGNIYVETSGDEVLEVTLCGFLGPTATDQDLEIDFTNLPQIASDHPAFPRTPETLILHGFGTNNNYTNSSVTGPAWFDVLGTLIENSSDTVTKIILLGVVKGSGGSSYPYSYLFKGNVDSILTPLSTAPTCNGRELP